jgi:5-methylcytosine-specific restriction endonuclease McrA
MPVRTEAQRRAQKKYRASPKGREAQARWNARRRESGASRKWRLTAIYGLTQEQVDAQFERQGCACAICGTTEPRGRHNVFHVDHNHKTGEFRGLLCDSCNRGIGYLKDNPELLQKAAAYVARP